MGRRQLGGLPLWWPDTDSHWSATPEECLRQEDSWPVECTCKEEGWRIKDVHISKLFLIPHINLLIPLLQGAPSTDGVGGVRTDTFLTGCEIFTHVHLMFDQLWGRWGGREWREGGSEGVRKEGIVFCTCTSCPSILLVITARCLNLLSAVDFLPNVLPSLHYSACSLIVSSVYKFNSHTLPFWYINWCTFLGVRM